MRLKENFSLYQLTSGQNALIDELEIFLADNSTCFLLKGYAGTGKTFMMKGLTEYLTMNKRAFSIAAPTGRAAKVISQKTKHKAYTIHKSIYSNKDLKEFKVNDDDGTETFKFYYELKENEDPINTVYIIDEASMLSNAYSEGEFFRFGSGYLLNDLISFINFDGNENNKKIILIGDNAQLPPVGMSFSPALDSKYLKENCKIETKEFELTEVVRQKEDSGILHNATILRNQLKENKFNKLDIETNFKDINQTKHEEVLSKYLLACNNKIDEETIIIAYSNSSVKQYNELVRMHFFPEKGEISINDKIILVSNNYNYEIELLNGDFGIVKHANSKNEKRQVTIIKKNKKGENIEVIVPLVFRDLVIEFKDINDTQHSISCKVIENLLDSEKRDINSDEQKAIYIDFWIRNPKLNQIKQLLHSKSINYDKLKEIVMNLSPSDLDSKTIEKIKQLQAEYFKNPNSTRLREISIFVLKDALSSDPYFNALRIKYGYAVTCHKAQGGEWKNAILNCKTSLGYFNSTYFRWLYTGITRAKDNLFLVDEPHFKVGSNLLPPRNENISSRNDLILLNSEIVGIELPFDFTKNQIHLINIYYAVFDLLKDDGIAISRIEHNSFHEIYHIQTDDENFRVKIYYKEDGKTSSITVISESENAKLIESKLKLLENKIIILPEAELNTAKDDIEFQFDNLILKEFYESIKQRVNPSNIQINRIEHYQYQEIYEFRKNGFIATYKFYYNAKGVFGKTEIVEKRTTGLTEEINQLLN